MLVLCPQDPTTSQPYYKRIAEHFEQAGNLEEAERHFIKAGMAHQVSLQDSIRQSKARCAALHWESGPCCCMLAGWHHCVAVNHSLPAVQAFEMYAQQGRWEAAHKVAAGYLSEQEVSVSVQKA